MSAIIRGARPAALTLLLLIVTVALQAQAPAIVSLKISHEVAPKGAIAQVKVFVTEPKPITTGRLKTSFGAFSSIEGIALAAEDAAAIAVVRGPDVLLSIVSPSASFGTDPDYPVLTIAGRVDAAAPVGTRFPISLDLRALQLLDPSGAVYPYEVKDGSVMVGGTLSIGDVIPGDADLPAGAVVSILGTGFGRASKVRLKDTILASTLFVNPARLDVVLAEPARMRSKAIRVRNGNDESTYFSYQRHYRADASAHAVLRDVVPVFAAATATVQSVAVNESSAGIALQNPGAADVFVVAELVDTSGKSLEPPVMTYVDVPSQKYVVRATSEIFGTTTTGPGLVRLTSPTPIRALGVDLDAAGNASPRLPQ